MFSRMKKCFFSNSLMLNKCEFANWKVIFLSVCSLAIVAVLLQAVALAWRDSVRRPQSMSKLKQLAFALNCYHDVYKSFPPAYVADKNGKPLYSWRVLILPNIGENELYQRF